MLSFQGVPRPDRLRPMIILIAVGIHLVVIITIAILSTGVRLPSSATHPGVAISTQPSVATQPPIGVQNQPLEWACLITHDRSKGLIGETRRFLKNCLGAAELTPAAPFQTHQP